MFWYDDQFRYDGQRGSWEDTNGDPTDEHYPVRGYAARLQRHIDDPFLDHLERYDEPPRG